MRKAIKAYFVVASKERNFIERLMGFFQLFHHITRTLVPTKNKKLVGY